MKKTHELPKGGSIHPVVPVHNLEIGSPGFLYTAVDRRTVAAVLFIDDPENIRVFLYIFLRNLHRPVGGTVVDNQHLDLRQGFGLYKGT